MQGGKKSQALRAAAIGSVVACCAALVGGTASAATKATPAAPQLLELHTDGSIWGYPTAGSGGWTKIAAAGPNAQVVIGNHGSEIFRLETNGTVWGYTSTGGWNEVDSSSANVKIATAGYGVMELHKDGTTWLAGTAAGGAPEELGNNGASGIVTAGTSYYEISANGAIRGMTYPGYWFTFDANPQAAGFAVDDDSPNAIFELHTDGTVWQYTGNWATTGWKKIATHPGAVQIAAGPTVGSLYELDGNGQVQQYNETSGTWTVIGVFPSLGSLQVDDNGTLYAHVATGFFKGFTYQYTGSGTTWEVRDSNAQTASIAAGNTRDSAR